MLVLHHFLTEGVHTDTLLSGEEGVTAAAIILAHPHPHGAKVWATSQGRRHLSLSPSLAESERCSAEAIFNVIMRSVKILMVHYETMAGCRGQRREHACVCAGEWQMVSGHSPSGHCRCSGQGMCQRGSSLPLTFSLSLHINLIGFMGMTCCV